jgi:hypothetical protein
MYILLVLTPIRDTYHTHTSHILDSTEAVQELAKQYPSSVLFTLCLNNRALTEYLELKGAVPAVAGDSLITLEYGV